MQEHELKLIRQAVQLAIEEDACDFSAKIPRGDHSSLSCIGPEVQAHARLLVKQSGLLAGAELAGIIFEQIDPRLEVSFLRKDGDLIAIGEEVMHVKGSALSILQAERLVLNYMQRMSGIAGITRRYVQLVSGTGCKILDTRKTSPGLRFFEKWAVRIGGGMNHRFGLYDMIMLKDNHVDFCGGVKNALKRAAEYKLRMGLNIPVEIETRNIAEVKEALEQGGANRIMLDNFKPEAAAEAVRLIDKRCEVEISGGINEQSVRIYAETGADFISVGALTHSVQSLDLSLKAVI
jgi:nicotinate-nucleotide pyrophosphorylase (carboxylating)